MAEVWGAAAIGGAISLGGSLIAGNATKKAQQAANTANAKIASDTNAQNWNQYLLQRGVNPGGIAGVSGSNVNTVLPLGFTLGGQPAEQAIFDQIMKAGQGAAQFDDPNYTFSDENISSFFEAHPEVQSDLSTMLSESGDKRSVPQWLRDNAAAGDTNFTNQLKQHSNIAKDTYTQSLQLPPQYQKLLQYGPETLDALYGGEYLRNQQGYQGQINDARTALAGTVQQRINELRTKYGELNQGQLSDIDKILAARTQGSQGIYDATLTQADTYANAVKQATADELQRQQAQRALQGFIGEGSGDALMRARTLAGGYQAAAGARAQAGVDQAGRLYGINDADATSRFGVNSEYMKALTTFLDADARAAEGQANLENQTDNASVYSNDVATRLANLGVGGQLVTQRQGIESAQAAKPYEGINQMLSALNFFRNTPSTPGTVSPTYSQPINSGQIAGGAISSVGTGLANYYQNKSLTDAIKGLGNTGSSTGYYTPGGYTGVQTDWSSMIPPKN
jgi:hypothetical protein